MPENPTPWEKIYQSTTSDCRERALALDSAGIPYAIEGAPGGGLAIFVAGVDAARASDEIKAYGEENPAEVRRVAAAPHRGNGWAGVIGYAIILSLFAAFQVNDIFARDWLGAGRINSGLIRRGEIWRTVTALTLHMDLVHLIGNIAIGSLVGVFVGQLLGSGLAWFTILLAGAVGNLLSASFRPDGHSSIGASTAVFAALGILAGYEWVRRQRAGPSFLLRYAPIVGGLVLLSYLGTGGERTDVLAHVAGFASGLLLGAIYGKLGNRIVPGRKGQILLGMFALAVVSLSWAIAFQRR